MPFQPAEMTAATLKGFVDRLHRYSKATPAEAWPPKRAWAQEAIARALGFPHYHAAQMALQSAIPASLDPAPESTAAVSRPFAWPICSETMKFAGLSLERINAVVTTGSDAPFLALLSEATVRQHVLVLGVERERRQMLETLLGRARAAGKPLLWVQGASALRPKATSTLCHDPALALRIFEVQPSGEALGEHLAYHRWGKAIDLMLLTLEHHGLLEGVDRSGLRHLMEGLFGMLTLAAPDADGQDGHLRGVSREVLREHLDWDALVRLTTLNHLANRQRLNAYFDHLGIPDKAHPSAHALALHRQYQALIERALDALAFPVEMAPYLLIRLPYAGLQEAQGVLALCGQWARHHRDGLVVFDGLDRASSLYPWLLSQFAELEEHHHGVILTTRSLAELPEDVSVRLLDRIGEYVVLDGMRSAAEDARRLGLTNPGVQASLSLFRRRQGEDDLGSLD